MSTLSGPVSDWSAKSRASSSVSSPAGRLGVGVLKPKSIGLDLSYQAALYEDRTVVGNRNPTVNGTYKSVLHTGGISIRVAF